MPPLDIWTLVFFQRPNNGQTSGAWHILRCGLQLLLLLILNVKLCPPPPDSPPPLLRPLKLDLVASSFLAFSLSFITASTPSQNFEPPKTAACSDPTDPTAMTEVQTTSGSIEKIHGWTRPKLPNLPTRSGPGRPS